MSWLEDTFGPPEDFKVGDTVWILNDSMMPGRKAAVVTAVMDGGPIGHYYECDGNKNGVWSPTQLRRREPEGS